MNIGAFQCNNINLEAHEAVEQLPMLIESWHTGSCVSGEYLKYAITLRMNTVAYLYQACQVEVLGIICLMLLIKYLMWHTVIKHSITWHNDSYFIFMKQKKPTNCRQFVKNRSHE